MSVNHRGRKSEKQILFRKNELKVFATATIED